MILMIYINFLGNLVVISSSSWLITWLGLEIMSLSMPSIVIMSNPSVISKINAWKYFMIQCYSSIILFVSTICMSTPMNLSMSMIQWVMILISMLIKMGIIPFHAWLIQISSSISWYAFLLMSSIQKIGPMIAMSEMMEYSNFSYSTELMLSLFVSLLSLMGMIIKSVRFMLVFSSMINSAWMLAVMSVSKYMFYMFIVSYILHILILFNVFMNNFSWSIDSLFFYEKKYFIFELIKFMVILSLVGMPPLMGFFMKISVLGILMMSNQIFLCLILTLSSSVMMLMYLSFIIIMSTSLSIEKIQFDSDSLIFLGMLILMLGLLMFFFC